MFRIFLVRFRNASKDKNQGFPQESVVTYRNHIIVQTSPKITAAINNLLEFRIRNSITLKFFIKVDIPRTQKDKLHPFERSGLLMQSLTFC